MTFRSKDHSGITYGNWKALEYRGHGKSKKIMWLCECVCGTQKVVRIENITNGHVVSCGCSRDKHGMVKSSEYSTWCNMKARCKNPNHRQRHYYGISYDDKWENFESFLEDMGKKPSNRHTLERIDNDKGYNKVNCKWATPKEQAQNRRTTHIVEYKGEKYTLSDLSVKSGIKHVLLRDRIFVKKWSVKNAVETPVKVYKKRK